MNSPSLLGSCLIYTGLVFNFYHLSDGFKGQYTFWYTLWKIVPIAFLALYAYVNGNGAKHDVRLKAALGLVFGGIGDYLIGISPEGLVPAAISFGVGHVLYMMLYFGNPTRIHWTSLYSIIAWNTLVGIVCLLPWMAEHFFGVLILILYSFLLSASFIVAISQYVNRESDEDPNPLFARLVGFGLFYASDSILITSRSLGRIPHADLLCLSTYYAAQLFILVANVTFAKKLA